MLFVWIIWIVALLVLYHKVYVVYYFDLGHGLVKEVITAGIIAFIMTGLTFYLWWLTAIIIIILGIALMNKVSSKIPLVIAIIFAIIVAIMGISFRASSDSDGTTVNVNRIIQEIKEEYFWKEKEQNQGMCCSIITRGNSYYFEYIGDSSCFSGKDKFCARLKKRYHQLIRERQESEIGDDIGQNISLLFIASCDLIACLASREYEILKYTLSEQRQCDYFDNGKFIAEMEEDDIFSI